MTRAVAILSGLLACAATVLSQTPRLNVLLRIDAVSAERALDLYEGKSVAPRELAALPGSRLALKATAVLADSSLQAVDLEKAIEDARFNSLHDDDVFGMTEARRQAGEIRTLLEAIRRRNFAGRVASTVSQLFPPDTDVRVTVPVYLVAFGPPTIDAFVQRVIWSGDEPSFAPGGELTIVLNLSRALAYGMTTDERLLGSLSTVAHEVFHAAFGAYQDSSALWRRFHAEHRDALTALLELTQNEGLAHYLSFEQRGGIVPRDWDTRVRTSFGEFNRSSAELASPGIGAERADELIRASNTSEYWESYGVVTGLFIAREIDRTVGRPALVATVADGPLAFFAAYERLCAANSNLPALSPVIRSRLSQE